MNLFIAALFDESFLIIEYYLFQSVVPTFLYSINSS
nr:MAG TPA: hypothetical protein [Caudoviricetes sp.]